MDRIDNSIPKIYTRCLTVRLHSPHVYSTISVPRRIRLISPRFRLVSSRRNTDAREGLVLWRGLGGSLASWISRTSRSMAACRLRSCDRCWRASIISTPSVVNRLPASLASRCFTSGGSEGDWRRLNRSWTAVDTLLTFCPPGPGARMKMSSISSSLSWIVGVMVIMRLVYQLDHCSVPCLYVWQLTGTAPFRKFPDSFSKTMLVKLIFG